MTHRYINFLLLASFLLSPVTLFSGNNRSKKTSDQHWLYESNKKFITQKTIGDIANFTPHEIIKAASQLTLDSEATPTVNLYEALIKIETILKKTKISITGTKKRTDNYIKARKYIKALQIRTRYFFTQLQAALYHTQKQLGPDAPYELILEELENRINDTIPTGSDAFSLERIEKTFGFKKEKRFGEVSVWQVSTFPGASNRDTFAGIAAGSAFLLRKQAESAQLDQKPIDSTVPHENPEWNTTKIALIALTGTTALAGTAALALLLMYKDTPTEEITNSIARYTVGWLRARKESIRSLFAHKAR